MTQTFVPSISATTAVVVTILAILYLVTMAYTAMGPTPVRTAVADIAAILALVEIFVMNRAIPAIRTPMAVLLSQLPELPLETAALPRMTFWLVVMTTTEHRMYVSCGLRVSPVSTNLTLV
jgi:hypothetical protein